MAENMWSQDLWLKLPQGVLGERHQGRSDLHRTRQEEDGDSHGRRVRPEAPRTHPVQFWRLSVN